MDVKWIDPDVWGLRAWSTLFACAKKANQSDRSWEAWILLVSLLRRILPCDTCRTCCGAFIQEFPSNRTTSAEEWLCKLRAKVETRNYESKDCNRLEKLIRSRHETCQESISRFAFRQSMVPLWKMDVFVFLFCVAKTVRLSLEDWTVLFQAISLLSPVKLFLLDESGYPQLKQAAQQSVDINALGAILKTIKVNTRVAPLNQLTASTQQTVS